jgi:hypothetical protein
MYEKKQGKKLFQKPTFWGGLKQQNKENIPGEGRRP